MPGLGVRKCIPCRDNSFIFEMISSVNDSQYLTQIELQCDPWTARNAHISRFPSREDASKQPLLTYQKEIYFTKGSFR